MRKRFIFQFIFLFAVCSGSATYAQTTVWTMQHDGVERSFRVHLPPATDTCERLPLIFNLHGRGSAGWQEEFYTRFSDVADTGRFIAVYPDAINAEWDINGPGVDDVGFIQAMIDTLYATYRVDRNRVYSCGMSMGGYMSYRLACELTDHIAAIASVTGAFVTVPCNPTRPIAVMQIHGTDDSTVPYSTVTPTINAWLQKNNCPTTPVVTQLPDIVTTDSSTVTLSYHGPCDDSTEVILYTVNNGEHTWPDAAINIGITTKDINASSIIWNFFKKYQLDSYPESIPCTPTTRALDEIKNRNTFRVQYNSAIRQLIVESTLHENFYVSMFDALGRKLNDFHATGNVTAIPCSLPSPGIYFYVIGNENGPVEKGKVIVR
jgi:polyhydroxybutyrate depolymerase